MLKPSNLKESQHTEITKIDTRKAKFRLPTEEYLLTCESIPPLKPLCECGKCLFINHLP